MESPFAARRELSYVGVDVCASKQPLDSLLLERAARLPAYRIGQRGVVELQPLPGESSESEPESTGVAAVNARRHGKRCGDPRCPDRLLVAGFNEDTPAAIEAVRRTKISRDETVTRLLVTIDLDGALIVDGRDTPLTADGLLGSPKDSLLGGEGDPRQLELVRAIRHLGADGVWLSSDGGDYVVLFLSAFERKAALVRDVALWRISHDHAERDPDQPPPPPPPGRVFGRLFRARCERCPVRWWSLRRQVLVVLTAMLSGVAVAIGLDHVTATFGLGSGLPLWIPLAATVIFVIGMSPFVIAALRPYKKRVVEFLEVPQRLDRMENDVEYLRRRAAEDLDLGEDEEDDEGDEDDEQAEDDDEDGTGVPAGM